jgi:hypothetical protein
MPAIASPERFKMACTCHRRSDCLADSCNRNKDDERLALAGPLGQVAFRRDAKAVALGLPVLSGGDKLAGLGNQSRVFLFA